MTPLKQFCCCELDRGLLFWGWLGVIFAILDILRSLGTLIFGLDYYIHALHMNRYTFEYIHLFTGIISLAVCYMLIIAVQKRNRYFMLPYMFWYSIGILLLFVIVIFSPVFGIAIPLCVYIYYCLYSFYKELADEETNRAREASTFIQKV